MHVIFFYIWLTFFFICNVFTRFNYFYVIFTQFIFFTIFLYIFFILTIFSLDWFSLFVLVIFVQFIYFHMIFTYDFFFTWCNVCLLLNTLVFTFSFMVKCTLFSTWSYDSHNNLWNVYDLSGRELKVWMKKRKKSHKCLYVSNNTLI